MGKQLLGLILDRGAARKIALAGGREIFADARPTFSPILGREEEKKNPAKNLLPSSSFLLSAQTVKREGRRDPSFFSLPFFELLSSFLLLP